MKNLVAVIIAVVAFSASVFADDYVVVKNNDQITINQVTVGGSGTVYINTSILTNPTVKQLSDIGLPNYCWSWVDGQDGAYDTRLMKAEQDLAEAKTNYENEVENTKYLEESIGWHKLWHFILAVALIAAILVAIERHLQIKKLKK